MRKGRSATSSRRRPRRMLLAVGALYIRTAPPPQHADLAGWLAICLLRDAKSVLKGVCKARRHSGLWVGRCREIHMASFANWFVSLTRSAPGAIVFGLALCGPAWAVLVTLGEQGHGTADTAPPAIAPDPGPGGLMVRPVTVLSAVIQLSGFTGRKACCSPLQAKRS